MLVDLVPHMSINLTGEKNQHDAQRSERSIRTFTNQDGRTRTGQWKTGSWCLDDFGANFWTQLPNFLHSFNHNKDRNDVYKPNREQEQNFFFPTSICNPFLRWSFHFTKKRLAGKMSAVLSFCILASASFDSKHVDAWQINFKLRP